MDLVSMDNVGLVKCNFTMAVLWVNKTLDRWPDDTILKLTYTDYEIHTVGIHKDIKEEEHQGRRL